MALLQHRQLSLISQHLQPVTASFHLQKADKRLREGDRALDECLGKWQMKKEQN